MVEFIQSGFWKAFLFTVIVGIIGTIISLVFKKKVPVLAVILQTAPGIAAFFYVWTIRHGIGWLIFGILGAIGFVITIIFTVIGSNKTA